VNRKKIMLADDVDLFLELEKTFFQRREFDLVVARTGQQAVDLASAERPDLIFMDLSMPELNGDEACARIKRDPQLCHIPLVMVTPGSKEEDIARCRAAGCDEILFKPINRHLFMTTAQHFLQLTERESPRIRVHLPVHYGRDPQKMMSDYAGNLSESGMFIITSKSFELLEVLSLEFLLPDVKRTIRCKAIVSWLNRPGQPIRPSLPPGLGVEFEVMTADDLSALREFIKQECLTPSW